MRQAVKNYIEAYNNFNVEGMLVDLDENIVFENIANGETNLLLEGLADFKKQAELAASYFTTRHQEVIDWQITGNQIKANVKYTAVLAKDLNELLKKGDELSVTGTSTFLFNENHKISKIVDQTL